MAEKFLNGPDVVAAFQELSSERMPEGVARGAFGLPRLFHRAFNRLLNDRFVDVMPSFLPGLRVFSAGKPTASAIPSARWDIVQGVGPQHATPAVGQATFVDVFRPFKLFQQWGFGRSWQHGDSVLRSLSISDDGFVAGEVDILYAQAQAFHQA